MRRLLGHQREPVAVVSESIGDLLMRSGRAISCLASMDDLDREVLVDHVVVGRTLRDIAAEIGEFHGVTSERLWRARKQLAEALDFEIPEGHDGRCARCGKPFKAATRNNRLSKRFCSENCQKRAWEARAGHGVGMVFGVAA